MDRSWLITDEALVHDPDCNHQDMPMDVCNCQQKQLFRMINERDAQLITAYQKMEAMHDYIMRNMNNSTIQLLKAGYENWYKSK